VIAIEVTPNDSLHTAEGLESVVVELHDHHLPHLVRLFHQCPERDARSIIAITTLRVAFGVRTLANRSSQFRRASECEKFAHTFWRTVVFN
jgi:hypothetical protein